MVHNFVDWSQRKKVEVKDRGPDRKQGAVVTGKDLISKTLVSDSLSDPVFYQTKKNVYMVNVYDTGRVMVDRGIFSMCTHRSPL